MTWKIVEVERDKVSPMMVYELARRHKLVPDEPESVVTGFKALAWTSKFYQIQDDDEHIVATVIVNNIWRGDQADLDLIPEDPSQFFMGYESDLREVMTPLITKIFEEFRLRRLNAKVPDSRNRTKRALRDALGFTHEGKSREGVQFSGQAPEDVHNLGLLKREWEHCYG